MQALNGTMNDPEVPQNAITPLAPNLFISFVPEYSLEHGKKIYGVKTV